MNNIYKSDKGNFLTNIMNKYESKQRENPFKQDQAIFRNDMFQFTASRRDEMSIDSHESKQKVLFDSDRQNKYSA